MDSLRHDFGFFWYCIVVVEWRTGKRSFQVDSTSKNESKIKMRSRCRDKSQLLTKTTVKKLGAV